MILDLGNKKIDLDQAFPLTIGDLKALEALGMVNQKGEVNAGSPVLLSGLLLHLARKIDREVTEAEIDEIPVHKLEKLGDFFEAKMKEVGIDRPT